MLSLIASFFILTAHASTYGSNYISSVSCVADTDSGAPYLCGSANDGNDSTAWISANASTPHWIYFDAGSTKNLGKLSLMPYTDSNGSQVKNFDIEGSTSSVVWSPSLFNATSANTLATPTRTDYIINSTSSYRYYRIYINSSWRATGQSGIFDAQLFECLDCGVASSSTTSTIGFMSPQLDFMLQLLVEAIFVLLGLFAGYLVIKKFTKK